MAIQMCIPTEMEAAKILLNIHRPYLSVALWNMKFVSTLACPTMGVDQFWRCYYNPETLKEWKVPEIAAVMEHELWHLLRFHHSRAPASVKDSLVDQYYHKIWNYATDCEINDDLHEASQNAKVTGNPLRLPKGGIYPSKFGFTAHELAETYYDKLLKKIKNCNQGQGQGQGQGQQGQQGKGQGKGQGKDLGDGTGEPGEVPFGGSAADGVARPWEQGQEPGKPKPGPNELDQELIRQQVARAI